MKKRVWCFVFFALPFWFTTLAQSQDDKIKQEIATIAERVDSATAATTSELLALGVPSHVEAYKLAYQGIDSKAIAELGAAGLDLPMLFRNWPPKTIQESAIFSDWIVLGEVIDILYVPEAQFNKYVYVRVKRWLKGDSPSSTVVLRATGSGPTSNPRIFSRVSHETKYKKGDELLLLLNRCGFLLYANQLAPYETEKFKGDYEVMCFANTWKKLTIKGNFLVEVSDYDSKTLELDNIVNDISRDAKRMEKFFRKGAHRHE